MISWEKAVCTTCGTAYWTVLETRSAPWLTKRRRMLCHNGHRFTVYTSAAGYVLAGPAKAEISAAVPTVSEPWRIRRPE